MKLIMNNVEETNLLEKNEFGNGILHCAVIKNDLETCKLIIEKIKNKNPRDKFGKTTFHYAAQLGHNGICQLFIEIIENLSPVYNNKTPFDLAKEKGHDDICNLIKFSREKQNEERKNQTRRKL